MQLPWREGTDEQHRFDVLRLMSQAPGVVDVMLIDGSGRERLHVSRVNPDIVNSGVDHSQDPAVIGARVSRLWYGPVTLYGGSEPHLAIAVAGPRAANGVTLAVINLKLIWDVISSIHVGQSGDAFVLDSAGRLVAHPDISLVLRGDDDPAAARLRELQQAMIAAGGETTEGINAEHRPVIAAMAPIRARAGRPLSRNQPPRPSPRSVQPCGGPGCCCCSAPSSLLVSVISWRAGWSARSDCWVRAPNAAPAVRPEDRDHDRRRVAGSGAAI